MPELVLFLDRASALPKVSTEGVRRVRLSFLQVFLEVQLLRQFLTCLHTIGLLPLHSPYGRGDFEDSVNFSQGDEDDSVIICEDGIASVDREITELGRGQVHGTPLIKTTGPNGIGSVTEEWKSNLYKLRRVPMVPPDDDTSQTPGPGLQDSEVTDTALIGLSSVVDY